MDVQPWSHYKQSSELSIRRPAAPTEGVCSATAPTNKLRPTNRPEGRYQPIIRR